MKANDPCRVRSGRSAAGCSARPPCLVLTSTVASAGAVAAAATTTTGTGDREHSGAGSLPCRRHR